MNKIIQKTTVYMLLAVAFIGQSAETAIKRRPHWPRIGMLTVGIAGTSFLTYKAYNYFSKPSKEKKALQIPKVSALPSLHEVALYNEFHTEKILSVNLHTYMNDFIKSKLHVNINEKVADYDYDLDDKIIDDIVNDPKEILEKTNNTLPETEIVVKEQEIAPSLEKEENIKIEDVRKSEDFNKNKKIISDALSQSNSTFKIDTSKWQKPNLPETKEAKDITSAARRYLERKKLANLTKNTLNIQNIIRDNKGRKDKEAIEIEKIKTNKSLVLNEVKSLKKPLAYECCQEAAKKINNPEYQIFPENYVLPKYHIFTDVVYNIIKQVQSMHDTLQQQYKNIGISNYYIAKSLIDSSQIAQIENYKNLNFYNYDDILIKIISCLEIASHEQLLSIQEYFLANNIDHLTNILNTPYNELASYLSQKYNDKFIYNFASHSEKNENFSKTRNALKKHEGTEWLTTSKWYGRIKYTYDEKNTDDLTQFINSNEELKNFFQKLYASCASDLLALTPPNAKEFVEKCETFLGNQLII